MTNKPISPRIGPVNGLFLTVADSLAGAKSARRYGDTLFVSPAMWELLHGAEGPTEFAFIMDHIPVVVVPYIPPGYFAPVYPPVFALRPTGPMT